MAKRVFPPEWYAAQAARRKNKGEAPAKSGGAAPAKPRVKTFQFGELNAAHKAQGPTKSWKGITANTTSKDLTRWNHSISFRNKKGGGIVAESSKNGGAAWPGGVTKVRDVDKATVKRYLRMAKANMKKKTGVMNIISAKMVSNTKGTKKRKSSHFIE